MKPYQIELFGLSNAGKCPAEVLPGNFSQNYLQGIFFLFCRKFFVHNLFCFDTLNNIVKVMFLNCCRVDLECKYMRSQIALYFVE